MSKLVWRHGPEHGRAMVTNGRVEFGHGPTAEHYVGTARNDGPQWHVIREHGQSCFEIFRAWRDGSVGDIAADSGLVITSRTAAMQSAETFESDRLAAVAARRATRAVHNGLWALYRYGHA